MKSEDQIQKSYIRRIKSDNWIKYLLNLRLRDYYNVVKEDKSILSKTGTR